MGTRRLRAHVQPGTLKGQSKTCHQLLVVPIRFFFRIIYNTACVTKVSHVLHNVLLACGVVTLHSF
jgi:hypothetical protein